MPVSLFSRFFSASSEKKRPAVRTDYQCPVCERCSPDDDLLEPGLDAGFPAVGVRSLLTPLIGGAAATGTTESPTFEATAIFFLAGSTSSPSESPAGLLTVFASFGLVVFGLVAGFASAGLTSPDFVVFEASRTEAVTTSFHSLAVDQISGPIKACTYEGFHRESL